MSGAPRRVVLDVGSLIRWVGPPVGIARVEHALAMAARARGDGLVAFDLATGELRGLAPRWANTVLGWGGLVDRHIPRGWARDLLSRQGAVMALERLRLTTGAPWLAGLADRAQRAMLALRPHRFPLQDAAGARIANVPAALAFGPPERLGPGDMLLLAGGGWSAARVAALAALRRRDGFALAALCYDLIPLTHPQFYPPEEVAAFAAHWRALLPLLDRLMVTSRAIAGDVGRWAAQEDIAAPPVAIVDLGFDPPADGAAAVPLPEGLQAGCYALFVSTVEPRKGHAVLLAAWRLLLARGLPQRLGFRLVLVGRPGWMVADVLRDLAAPPEGVLYLAAAPDALVAALYRGAAFCCYPSEYEGFGLPLLEAFARGRAVLASNGGALPETAGAFGRCLDPHDAGAWADAMAEWMDDPLARQPFEARIARDFRQPAWPEAAGRILELARRAAPAAGDARLRRRT